MIFFTNKDEKEKFLKVVTHLENYHKAVTEYESQFEAEALMNRLQFLISELERVKEYQEALQNEVAEIQEKVEVIKNTREEIDVQYDEELV